MEQSPNSPGSILVITCECGYVIKGDIAVELIANARNHIDEAHPEAELSDEELLAEAQEQPAV
jgi:predicted small metal-binding protein